MNDVGVQEGSPCKDGIRDVGRMSAAPPGSTVGLGHALGHLRRRSVYAFSMSIWLQAMSWAAAGGGCISGSR
jgi:hypothetical protein